MDGGSQNTCGGIPSSARVPGDGSGAAVDVERDAFLDKLAGSICDRGFGSAAMFLLESVKPLNFIGSQVLYALGPVASVIVQQSKWEKMAEALEDRATIDHLIDKIEAKEAGRSQKS